MDFIIRNNVIEKYLGSDEVVTIPNGTIAIGSWAFEQNPYIKEVIIPDGVVSIGYWAFFGCISLQKIILPNSVTAIYEGCFCKCVNLVEVTAPSDILFIGEDAFLGCNNLKEFTITDGLTVSNINFELPTALDTVPNVITESRIDIVKKSNVPLSEDCLKFLTTDNYTIQFDGSPIRLQKVQLPFYSLSFIKIFTKYATPEMVFKTISNLLTCKDSLSKAEIIVENPNRYIPNLESLDNQALQIKIKDICPNDSLVTYYPYEVTPEGIKSMCSLNVLDYAKTHNELYKFKLEILSAFIGKFGVGNQADIISATILDTLTTLENNQALDIINLLHTKDIYKNLWFN